MPPYQWNQYQSLRKCFQRLYYYYVLVLWATGGQANISTAYCHGFSSIYAAGKKGIYKIRPRSKERKRVQGGWWKQLKHRKGGSKYKFYFKLDPFGIYSLARTRNPTHWCHHYQYPVSYPWGEVLLEEFGFQDIFGAILMLLQFSIRTENIRICIC